MTFSSISETSHSGSRWKSALCGPSPLRGLSANTVPHEELSSWATFGAVFLALIAARCTASAASTVCNKHDRTIGRCFGGFLYLCGKVIWKTWGKQGKPR